MTICPHCANKEAQLQAQAAEVELTLENLSRICGLFSEEDSFAISYLKAKEVIAENQRLLDVLEEARRGFKDIRKLHTDILPFTCELEISKDTSGIASRYLIKVDAALTAAPQEAKDAAIVLNNKDFEYFSDKCGISQEPQGEG